MVHQDKQVDPIAERAQELAVVDAAAVKSRNEVPVAVHIVAEAVHN